MLNPTQTVDNNPIFLINPPIQIKMNLLRIIINIKMIEIPNTPASILPVS